MNSNRREVPGQQDLASHILKRELIQHGLQLWTDREASQGQIRALAIESLFGSDRLELAASLLPMVLAGTEQDALSSWQQLTDQLAADPGMNVLLAALPADTWAIFNGDGAGDAAGDDINEALQRLAFDTIAESPPDHRVLTDVRRLVLLSSDAVQAPDRGLLGLADAIDGLHDHRYLHFAHYLLGMSYDLIDQYEHSAEADPPPVSLTGLALEILPDISASFARDFAAVDPRINSTIAAVFNVLNALAAETAVDYQNLRHELTDSLAQMLLLVPDAAYYFDQPVRNAIREEIDICTSIVATAESCPETAVDRLKMNNFVGSFLCRVGKGSITRWVSCLKSPMPMIARSLDQILRTPWNGHYWQAVSAGSLISARYFFKPPKASSSSTS
jgi:hypothetical protein